MKNRFLLLCAAAALLLALAACKKNESTTATPATDTYASATTSTTATTPSTLSEDDKKFVDTVAEGNAAEVALGQLGAQKATNADVKSFANRMVTDHGKANDELKQLATNKGVTALPTEPNKEHQDVAAKLSKASGAAFDKDFMDGMVKGHEKVVALFEKESKDAKDADLKAWVSNTLPTIQDHLKMAKEIKGKLK